MQWTDIQKKRIGDLREMVQQWPDEGPVTGLNKEQLVEIVAKHLSIERPRKIVSGIDKSTIKQEIKALKAKRDEALVGHDSTALKTVRRQIHSRKRALRRSAIIR